MSGDLYEANYRVISKGKFPLQKSPDDPKISCVLKPGEKVYIKYTDNEAWCMIETLNGEKGWFAVDANDVIRGLGGLARDYFDGLSYAD